MRRISLAVALIGAVAATGCGGNTKPAANGGAKGTAGVDFSVTVKNQGPGTVTANPGALTCPADKTCSWTFKADTAVVLTATATGSYFNGWFGGCSGTGTCSLVGNADKYVVSYFSGTPQAHPNFNDGALHGPAVIAGALKCDQCHGAQLQGVGLAPACNACHAWPYTPALKAPASFVGHFNPANPAWGDHGGWSQACQRCHTQDGFKDYTGVIAAPTELSGPSADYLGSTFMSTNTLVTCTQASIDAGTCNVSAYRYGPMKCDTCHNSVTDPLTAGVTQVRFISGTQVTTDKVSALCGQCHEARESSSTIETKILAKNLTIDQQGTGFGFLNPHYLGAAATVFGADAAGWVQYAGNVYTKANQHGGVASCTACHDAHNGDVVEKVKADTCGKCHFNEAGVPVANFVELEESRQFGFEGDIDGNSVQESVKKEIDGLAAKLYAAIQAYASNVLSAPITYTDAYPYYMNAAGTSYTTFSPRLQRAAVNYKWYKADPGAWAHNPRYAIEVIYDSIADLNVALAPLGKQVPNGKRAFNGHFGAAEDASPYAAMIYHGGSNAVTGEVLPTMGFTSDACYQCHGGKVGFDTYRTSAPAAMPAGMTTNAAAKVTAMQCSTCHTLTGTDMKTIRSDVANVYFPPQKNGGNGQVTVPASALPQGFAVCATCHSGRENGASITAKIGQTPDTTWSLSVTNPHYLGAAGIMMGSTAGAMYQYAGKAYTAAPAFWSLGANGPHGSPHGASCAKCHNPQGSAHTFEIDLAQTVVNGTWGGAYPVAGMQPGAKNTAACNGCHAGAYSLLPIEEEYNAASAELYAAIRAYAVANLDAIKTATGNANATGICYWNAGVGGGAYYALEVNGVCQNGVAPAASISFTKANPKLLKAAFNYLWTQKEPGAWAHNEFYVMQVIYDSIVDLGGTPTFTVAAVTDATTRLPVAGDPLNRGY